MKTVTPTTLPIGVIVDNSAGVYSADEWNRALADTLRDFTGDEPAEKFLAEIAETDDEWQHEITDELHDALSEALELPEWYGRSLDALYDCLTDLSVPTTIHVENWPEEDYMQRALAVLRDAAEENELLQVRLED